MASEDVGGAMHALVRELYPICRSITGDGVRRTLRRLAGLAPVEIHEVPSGTPVLDWVVPPEWNPREAWIRDPSGKKVVDFADHSLHLMSYSIPQHLHLSRAELDAHLHSLPDHPDWIPYRTSYYNESWGFCLPHRQRESLPEGEYEVCIDARLGPGSLSYGELFLPGEEEGEILLSAHVCHPSLANDNLSGLAVATWLARAWAERPRRLGIRLLFIPGTIGSITWLSRSREVLPRVRAGLTLVCLGDDSPFTYKRSFGGGAPGDRAAARVLADSGHAHELVDFHPYGYDERQFASPGFRLPVGSLMRGRHGRFPEYHTSADDPSFVSPDRLAESLAVLDAWVEVLQGEARYRSTSPEGEPQLGRRGLYRAMGGESDPAELQMAMLWLLSCCDGGPTLLDVAERSGLPFAALRRAADLLLAHDLLAPLSDDEET